MVKYKEVSIQMSHEHKKGIRVDSERIDKIYKILDEAIIKSELHVNGAELLAVFYILMRNLEATQYRQQQGIANLKR
jgi:hypothetical protein